MLDKMRKHASSWIIRVIFGAIIVTFIFFFGYSSYRKGMRGGRGGSTGDAVAKVNDIPISSSEYEYFYERNYEQMRSNFKDKEIPDFVRNFTKQSTLNQLVNREIALQQADELSLDIPDEELADVIRKSMTNPEDHEFDPVAYRHNFLPYFKGKYGLDYEHFVRQDLRLSALSNIFDKVDKDITPASDESSNTTWTFETVTINPESLVNSKLINSSEEADAIAAKLIALGDKNWDKTLSPLKLKSKKVGPVTISERGQILEGPGPVEDFYAVFSLSKEKPVIEKPVRRGANIYVVRFVSKGKKTDETSSKPFTGDFFQTWMSKLMAKAKVQNYLEKEQ